MRRNRAYTIITTNCDCGSGIAARTTLRWRFGPRCPNCQRILGCMEWKAVGNVLAAGDYEAIQKYQQEKDNAKSLLPV